MSKTKKHIEHYPNGEIKEEGYYLDGKKDGKWTHWLSDGSLVCIERFKNGVKISEDISTNGRFYGKSIKWYANRVKKGEGNFIGDEIKKIGKWTWWWDNGNKKSEGHYEPEEKDGLWIYYNEDGSKKETIEYRNGREYICSSCKNKKGKITKQYCLSNPLNRNHEEEPAWEHYGGWHISQMSHCSDFCGENRIKR